MSGCMSLGDSVCPYLHTFMYHTDITSYTDMMQVSKTQMNTEALSQTLNALSVLTEAVYLFIIVLNARIHRFTSQ